MVDEGKLDDGKTGSVKAAISSYKVRILESDPAAIKKFQTNYPEKAYAKTRKLHKAMRDTDQFNENRKLAETATARAQSELAVAKQTVKDLNSRIEESNIRSKAEMEGLERLKIGEKKIGGALNPAERVIMRELESMKQELSKIKLDMATLLEEKRQAEKDRDDSLARAQSYMSSLAVMNKEIEGANEEHVLVELARIEAVKEYEQVEAQWREKATEYSTAIQEIYRKKQSMIQEVEDADELEKKLEITISDANVLANELKLVKEMDRRVERHDRAGQDCHKGDGSGSEAKLYSVMEELEAAKKELALVREESFQFMASMDIVRDEHEHMLNKVAKGKSDEKKTEGIIQNLNCKLLKAKVKLEEVAAAEDKARSITLNLLTTLEQLRSETEAAKKEHALISEETTTVKAEVQRIENEIDGTEDRLQIALQELEVAKSSEAAALQDLKALTEETMMIRASASMHSSRITISKFEYKYLTGHASGAKEIANKKVAAAQAWVEALQASEKEIEIRYEHLQRAITELKAREENEVNKTVESMNAKDMVENEFENWRRSMGPEKLKPEIAAFASKSKNRSAKMASARRGKGRAAASPMVHGTGTPRSASFMVRRRTKVIPNLAKFFSRKNSERNL